MRTEVSYRKLNNDRAKWLAKPMRYFEPASESALEFSYRAIQLGLVLELPVGEWVLESRKQLKDSLPKDALDLLQRNISDEGTHYAAFKFAEDVYPESKKYANEAALIAKEWDLAKDNPIHLAAIAETAIFLPSLAILRLYGGQSLSTLAGDISRDEYAHVATNRHILEATQDITLGNLSNQQKSLADSTLEWLIGAFEDSSLGIDFEWIQEQSDQLLENGNAPELQEISDHSEYTPPFERSNILQY